MKTKGKHRAAASVPCPECARLRAENARLREQLVPSQSTFDATAIAALLDMIDYFAEDRVCLEDLDVLRQHVQPKDLVGHIESLLLTGRSLPLPEAETARPKPEMALGNLQLRPVPEVAEQ